jgi:hypothetical protein
MCCSWEQQERDIICATANQYCQADMDFFAVLRTGTVTSDITQPIYGRALYPGSHKGNKDVDLKSS